MGRYQREARERDQGRGAFDTEVKALGRVPRSDVTVSRGPAPAAVLVVLDLPQGTPVAVRAREMYVDDQPAQVATSYIPADIAEGTALESEDSGPGGIISRFAELGQEQVKITETVDVRPPTDQEADFLGLSPGHQVYEIFHTGWTAEGRAVEVCLHVMPVHLWSLDYVWRPEADA